MELDNREQLAAVAVAEAEWSLAQAARDKTLSGVHPLRVAEAVHKLDVLKEQARYWSREHERYASLAPKGAASLCDLDKAATEVSQRRTELQQAGAELQHLRDYVRDEDRALADVQVAAAKAKLEVDETPIRRYDPACSV